MTHWVLIDVPRFTDWVSVTYSESVVASFSWWADIYYSLDSHAMLLCSLSSLSVTSYYFLTMSLFFPLVLLFYTWFSLHLTLHEDHPFVFNWSDLTFFFLYRHSTSRLNEQLFFSSQEIEERSPSTKGSWTSTSFGILSSLLILGEGLPRRVSNTVCTWRLLSLSSQSPFNRDWLGTLNWRWFSISEASSWLFVKLKFHDWSDSSLRRIFQGILVSQECVVGYPVKRWQGNDSLFRFREIRFFGVWDTEMKYLIREVKPNLQVSLSHDLKSPFQDVIKLFICLTIVCLSPHEEFILFRRHCLLEWRVEKHYGIWCQMKSKEKETENLLLPTPFSVVSMQIRSAMLRIGGVFNSWVLQMKWNDYEENVWATAIQGKEVRQWTAAPLLSFTV